MLDESNEVDDSRLCDDEICVESDTLCAALELEELEATKAMPVLLMTLSEVWPLWLPVEDENASKLELKVAVELDEDQVEAVEVSAELESIAEDACDELEAKALLLLLLL